MNSPTALETTPASLQEKNPLNCRYILDEKDPGIVCDETIRWSEYSSSTKEESAPELVENVYFSDLPRLEHENTSAAVNDPCPTVASDLTSAKYYHHLSALPRDDPADSILPFDAIHL